MYKLFIVSKIANKHNLNMDLLQLYIKNIFLKLLNNLFIITYIYINMSLYMFIY